MYFELDEDGRKSLLMFILECFTEHYVVYSLNVIRNSFSFGVFNRALYNIGKRGFVPPTLKEKEKWYNIDFNCHINYFY